MNPSAADEHDDSPKTGDDVDDPLADCPQPAFVDVKPVKGGCLIKQGERNKSSFKRYLFLLQDEYLYYYTDTVDAGPRGYGVLFALLREVLHVPHDSSYSFCSFFAYVSCAFGPFSVVWLRDAKLQLVNQKVCMKTRVSDHPVASSRPTSCMRGRHFHELLKSFAACRCSYIGAGQTGTAVHQYYGSQGLERDR